MNQLESWLNDNARLFDVYGYYDFCGIHIYAIAAYNNKKFMEEFHLDFVVYQKDIERYDIKEVNDVVIIVAMP